VSGSDGPLRVCGYRVHGPPYARRGTSPMNWDGYVIFDPGIDRPPQELPRKEARAAFYRLMDARHERIALLRKLCFGWRSPRMATFTRVG
jgi:hypothetical protein